MGFFDELMDEEILGSLMSTMESGRDRFSSGLDRIGESAGDTWDSLQSPDMEEVKRGAAMGAISQAFPMLSQILGQGRMQALGGTVGRKVESGARQVGDAAVGARDMFDEAIGYKQPAPQKESTIADFLRQNITQDAVDELVRGVAQPGSRADWSYSDGNGGKKGFSMDAKGTAARRDKNLGIVDQEAKEAQAKQDALFAILLKGKAQASANKGDTKGADDDIRAFLAGTLGQEPAPKAGETLAEISSAATQLAPTFDEGDIAETSRARILSQQLGDKKIALLRQALGDQGFAELMTRLINQ